MMGRVMSFQFGQVKNSPIDPIRDVECTVSAERSEVMCSDRFCFSGTL